MSPFVRIRMARRLALAGITRGTSPLEQNWGWDRGQPIDRIYIESFLKRHSGDIRGRVLEIGAPIYTTRFGHDVTRSDVLDVEPENPRATIVADLASSADIPSSAFDCFILTQTLQYVFDVHAAVSNVHRILAPSGVLLATLPYISRITPEPLAAVDYWRFTPAGCSRLFGDVFGTANIAVAPRGNVTAAMAFLTGLATEDLLQSDMSTHDSRFPVIVTVRAVKRCDSGT